MEWPEPSCATWRPPRRAFDKNAPWTGKKLRSAAPQVKQDRHEKPRASLCCANCRHPVTHPEAAIEINGQHFHVFTNPEGYSFEIRLFDTATCVRRGIATSDYTWFAGYAWQLALCSNCMLQLGWAYSRDSVPGFYGLIADRLTHSHG